MDIVTSDSTENLFWPPGSEIPEAEKNAEWDPAGERIIALYEAFEKNGYLDLDWQCPERRVPTPEGVRNVESAPVVQEETRQKEENTTGPDFMDFDFGDSHQKGPLRIRTPGSGELKGGARKKTASMESVMFSMRKHGLSGSPASRTFAVPSATPTFSSHSPSVNAQPDAPVTVNAETDSSAAPDVIPGTENTVTETV